MPAASYVSFLSAFPWRAVIAWTVARIALPLIWLQPSTLTARFRKLDGGHAIDQDDQTPKDPERDYRRRLRHALGDKPRRSHDALADGTPNNGSDTEGRARNNWLERSSVK